MFSSVVAPTRLPGSLHGVVEARAGLVSLFPGLQHEPNALGRGDVVAGVSGLVRRDVDVGIAQRAAVTREQVELVVWIPGARLMLFPLVREW